MRLTDLLADSSRAGASTDGDSSATQRAYVEMLRTLPTITDPEVGQRLLYRIADPDLRKAILDRMEQMAATLEKIETVGRFVQSHPDSPMAGKFADRLSTLADTEYRRGRLAEALGDQQSALGIYNRIVILAPKAPSAEQAREGIARIQSLAMSR